MEELGNMSENRNWKDEVSPINAALFNRLEEALETLTAESLTKSDIQGGDGIEIDTESGKALTIRNTISETRLRQLVRDILIFREETGKVRLESMTESAVIDLVRDTAARLKLIDETVLTAELGKKLGSAELESAIRESGTKILEGVNTRVTQVEVDIAENRSGLESTGTRITGLQSILDEVKTSISDLPGLRQKIEALEQREDRVGLMEDEVRNIVNSKPDLHLTEEQVKAMAAEVNRSLGLISETTAAQKITEAVSAVSGPLTERIVELTRDLEAQSGRRTYLHLRYSNDGSTLLGPESSSGSWLGILANESESASSEFSDYSWIKLDDQNIYSKLSSLENTRLTLEQVNRIIGELDIESIKTRLKNVEDRPDNSGISEETARELIESIPKVNPGASEERVRELIKTESPIGLGRNLFGFYNFCHSFDKVLEDGKYWGGRIRDPRGGGDNEMRYDLKNELGNIGIKATITNLVQGDYTRASFWMEISQFHDILKFLFDSEKLYTVSADVKINTSQEFDHTSLTLGYRASLPSQENLIEKFGIRRGERTRVWYSTGFEVWDNYTENTYKTPVSSITLFLEDTAGVLSVGDSIEITNIKIEPGTRATDYCMSELDLEYLDSRITGMTGSMEEVRSESRSEVSRINERIDAVDQKASGLTTVLGTMSGKVQSMESEATRISQGLESKFQATDILSALDKLKELIESSKAQGLEEARAAITQAVQGLPADEVSKISKVREIVTAMISSLPKSPGIQEVTDLVRQELSKSEPGPLDRGIGRNLVDYEAWEKLVTEQGQEYIRIIPPRQSDNIRSEVSVIPGKGGYRLGIVNPGTFVDTLVNFPISKELDTNKEYTVSCAVKFITPGRTVNPGSVSLGIGTVENNFPEPGNLLTGSARDVYSVSVSTRIENYVNTRPVSLYIRVTDKSPGHTALVQGDSIEVTEFKIESGTRATGYSIAPETVSRAVNRISDLEKKDKALETKVTELGSLDKKSEILVQAVDKVKSEVKIGSQNLFDPRKISIVNNDPGTEIEYLKTGLSINSKTAGDTRTGGIVISNFYGDLVGKGESGKWGNNYIEEPGDWTGEFVVSFDHSTRTYGTPGDETDTSHGQSDLSIVIEWPGGEITKERIGKTPKRLVSFGTIPLSSLRSNFNESKLSSILRYLPGDNRFSLRYSEGTGFSIGTGGTPGEWGNNNLKVYTSVLSRRITIRSFGESSGLVLSTKAVDTYTRETDSLTVSGYIWCSSSDREYVATIGVGGLDSNKLKITGSKTKFKFTLNVPRSSGPERMTDFRINFPTDVSGSPSLGSGFISGNKILYGEEIYLEEVKIEDGTEATTYVSSKVDDLISKEYGGSGGITIRVEGHLGRQDSIHLSRFSIVKGNIPTEYSYPTGSIDKVSEEIFWDKFYEVFSDSEIREQKLKELRLLYESLPSLRYITPRNLKRTPGFDKTGILGRISRESPKKPFPLSKKDLDKLSGSAKLRFMDISKSFGSYYLEDEWNPGDASNTGLSHTPVSYRVTRYSNDGGKTFTDSMPLQLLAFMLMQGGGGTMINGDFNWSARNNKFTGYSDYLYVDTEVFETQNEGGVQEGMIGVTKANFVAPGGSTVFISSENSGALVNITLEVTAFVCGVRVGLFDSETGFSSETSFSLGTTDQYGKEDYRVSPGIYNLPIIVYSPDLGEDFYGPEWAATGKLGKFNGVFLEVLGKPLGSGYVRVGDIDVTSDLNLESLPDEKPGPYSGTFGMSTRIKGTSLGLWTGVCYSPVERIGSLKAEDYVWSKTDSELVNKAREALSQVGGYVDISIPEDPDESGGETEYMITSSTGKVIQEWRKSGSLGSTSLIPGSRFFKRVRRGSEGYSEIESVSVPEYKFSDDNLISPKQQTESKSISNGSKALYTVSEGTKILGDPVTVVMKVSGTVPESSVIQANLVQAGGTKSLVGSFSHYGNNIYVVTRKFHDTVAIGITGVEISNDTGPYRLSNVKVEWCKLVLGNDTSLKLTPNNSELYKVISGNKLGESGVSHVEYNNGSGWKTELVESDIAPGLLERKVFLSGKTGTQYESPISLVLKKLSDAPSGVNMFVSKDIYDSWEKNSNTNQLSYYNYLNRITINGSRGDQFIETTYRLTTMIDNNRCGMAIKLGVDNYTKKDIDITIEYKRKFYLPGKGTYAGRLNTGIKEGKDYVISLYASHLTSPTKQVTFEIEGERFTSEPVPSDQGNRVFLGNRVSKVIKAQGDSDLTIRIKIIKTGSSSNEYNPSDILYLDGIMIERGSYPSSDYIFPILSKNTYRI